MALPLLSAICSDGSTLRVLSYGVLPVYASWPLPFCRVGPALSAEHRAWWSVEHLRLQAAEAIQQVHGVSQFCSATFVVNKKEQGKNCLIVDMRPYNSHCNNLPIAYDDLRDMAAFWSQSVQFLFSFDIRDGYHHFAIDPAHWQYFCWQVDSETWESQISPFGQNQAPSNFVRLLGAFMNWLKQLALVAPAFQYSKLLAQFDFTLMVNLDNILFVSYMSFEDTEFLIRLILVIFRDFGLQVHPEKSVTCPITMLEYLGFELRMDSHLRPTPSRMAKVRQGAGSLLASLKRDC